MTKFPIIINNVRVKADHNLFILSTTDKNDRLLIKLFHSTAEKIAAGFEKPNVYKLEYSGYRWDANEFMKMIKIYCREDKYFDGWITGKFLQGYIELIENKDYKKFIDFYINLGIKRLEHTPMADTMTDKEYDNAQIARYGRYLRGRNKDY